MWWVKNKKTNENRWMQKVLMFINISVLIEFSPTWNLVWNEY